MELAVDPAAVSGLLLAILRVAALVVASPLFPPSIPWVGKLALITVLGYALSEPLAVTPQLGELIGHALVNVAVGALLGFMTGILFHLFVVAGGLLDMQSGLAAGAILDPTTGTQSSVFGRLFTQSGLALFVISGGYSVLVRAVATSIEVVALDGEMTVAGASLAGQAVDLSARILVLGLELALPVAAALLLVELALGLASRFAPQTNVFILGLPLKLFVTLSAVGTVLVAFPGVATEVVASVEETAVEALRALVP